MVLLASLWSCFKDEEYNTNLVLRPMIQTVSGGDFVGYEDCVAYAFDADTAQWELLSWDDARNGVLRSKEDSTLTMLPFAVAQSYTEDELEDTMLSMRLACQSAMIVVAHNTTENYGYRLYSVGLNIETTYAYVRFRTWKEGEYTESNWIYYAPESPVADSTDTDSTDDTDSDDDDLTEDAESSDDESTDDDELTDDADSTDDAELADDAELTDDVESTDDYELTEDAESGEDAESTEDAELDDDDLTDDDLTEDAESDDTELTDKESTDPESTDSDSDSDPASDPEPTTTENTTEE